MPDPAPYRFHAFEVSYFSAKVRPALRAKRLHYEEVRADGREIKQRTGLGFIPIVVTPDGETWQDSTAIYDLLESRHPNPPLFPATPLQTLAAHLVELYSDEFALLPAMHYRWGSERGERTARARFAAMIGNDAIAKAAGDQMAAARLAVGATDETGPAIEAHTRDLLDALSVHFQAHDYLLGARISFADCALMGPLYGHFFNDLVSRELLLETATPVVGWIERCNFPEPENDSTWLADDALAPTLLEALRIMGQDGAPLILACLEAFQEWADTRPDEVDVLPRGVGTVEGDLRGTPVTRFAGSYAPWLVQRSLDAYASLDATDRGRVDGALAGSGWERILAHRPRHRVAKRGFDLVIEES